MLIINIEHTILFCKLSFIYGIVVDECPNGDFSTIHANCTNGSSELQKWMCGFQFFIFICMFVQLNSIYVQCGFLWTFTFNSGFVGVVLEGKRQMCHFSTSYMKLGLLLYPQTIRSNTACSNRTGILLQENSFADYLL